MPDNSYQPLTSYRLIPNFPPADNCFASRKPDPSISVAIYRPSNKSRPGLLQIFDHNVSRFDLVDKRGLEILFIHTLFSLLDLDYDERNSKEGSNMYISNMATGTGIAKSGSLGRRPASQERQSLQSASPNEIPISTHGDPASYVSHAISLLRADATQREEGSAITSNLLLIILKASSPETSAKAVKIASEIKNAYYRLPQAAKGKDANEDLFMYVREDGDSSDGGAKKHESSEAASGRPRIKLDASSSSPPSPPPPERAPYQPPSALSIYLSKSRLHEFEARLSRPRIPPKNPSPAALPNPRINPLAPASRPWLNKPGGSPTISSPTSAPMAPSGSSSSLGTGAKLLGKLGIGKGRESSEDGKGGR